MTVTFDRVAPVLPVRDVARALELYRKLGFTADRYVEGDAGEPPFYGFLERGPVQLHLSLYAELDPATNTSAVYLYVDDADALYAEWQSANLPGRWHPPKDTPYGLRELAYVDPDGNLLRVGSPMKKS